MILGGELGSGEKGFHDGIREVFSLDIPFRLVKACKLCFGSLDLETKKFIEY